MPEFRESNELEDCTKRAGAAGIVLHPRLCAVEQRALGRLEVIVLQQRLDRIPRQRQEGMRCTDLREVLVDDPDRALDELGHRVACAEREPDEAVGDRDRAGQLLGNLWDHVVELELVRRGHQRLEVDLGNRDGLRWVVRQLQKRLHARGPKRRV